MMPPMVVLPAPVTVRGCAAAPIAAVVRVPGTVPEGAPAAPRGKGPDPVLAWARLWRAPAPLTPVPMRLVIGSASVRPEPSTSIAAPEATVVVPAVVPRAVAFWTRAMPALIVVAPV